MGACDFGALVFLQDLRSDGSAPFASLSHRHLFLADLVVPLGTREGIADGISEGAEEGTSEGAEEGTSEGAEEGTSEGIAGAEEKPSEGFEEEPSGGAKEGTSEGIAGAEEEPSEGDELFSCSLLPVWLRADLDSFLVLWADLRSRIRCSSVAVGLERTGATKAPRKMVKKG